MNVGAKSKKSSGMCDNKGFSLVELIIVVAIMAVLIGVMAYSFQMVTGQQARECANNITLALDKAQTYAMSKSGDEDAYMELSKDGTGVVATYYVPDKAVFGTGDTPTWSVLEKETLGKEAVSVVCTFLDGSTVEITATDSVRIYYDRVGGAFREAVVVNAGGETTAYCESITITRGREYKIELITATGRHTLERIS